MKFKEMFIEGSGIDNFEIQKMLKKKFKKSFWFNDDDFKSEQDIEFEDKIIHINCKNYSKCVWNFSWKKD